MKVKKTIIFALFLACLLMIGAVSASGDANDTLAMEDMSDEISVANDNADGNSKMGLNESDGLAKSCEDSQIISQGLDEEILGENPKIDASNWAEVQNAISTSSEITVVLTGSSDYIVNSGVNIPYGKIITIEGNGKTIDAKGQSQIFFVDGPAQLTLKNLHIINGNIEGSLTIWGGAISAKDSKVTIINCTFAHNTARYMGGAIFADNSDITIIESDFQSNTANYQGGAIYAEHASHINITDSTFYENTKGSSDAIYVTEDCNLDMKGCTLIGDRVNGDITPDSFSLNSFFALKYQINNYYSEELTLDHDYKYNETSDCNLTDGIPITGTIKINGNGHAIDGAGAARIFLLRATGNLVLENIKLTNGYRGEGAAIYAESDSQMTITNAQFTGNAATYGGAIYAASRSRINITDSEFTQNSGMEGGVIMANARSIINMNNVGFNNNYARNGGVLYASGYSNINIIGSRFTQNNASASEGYGGALFIRDNSNINIVDTQFTGNGAYIGGAIYAIVDSNLNVNNCEFKGNRAQSGGAICSNAVIRNSTFINNVAQSGQAMYNGVAILCIFENNNCYNVKFPVLRAVSELTVPFDGYVTTIFNLTYNDEEFVGISTLVRFIDEDGNVADTEHERTGEYWNIPRNLETGVYTIEYRLDEYGIAPANTTLNVKTKTSIYHEMNHVQAIYGSGENITVTLYRHLDYYLKEPIANAELRVEGPDGTHAYLTNEKGQASISIPKISSGTYSLNIIYDGNKYDFNSSSQVNITILKANVIINAPNMVTLYNSHENLTVTVTDRQNHPAENVTLHLDLNGLRNYTTDANGKIHVSTDGLDVGNYELFIDFDGNDCYESLTKRTSLAIQKSRTVLSANSTYVETSYSLNKDIIITLKGADNLPISGAELLVNYETKHITNETGQIRISTKDLGMGTKNIKISYFGSKNYLGTGLLIRAVIKPDETKITAEAVGNNLKITLTDAQNQRIANANITVYITDFTEHITDSNGQVTILLSYLPADNYTAYIFYDGNEMYNASFAAVNVTVDAIETQFTTAYDDNVLEITLEDKNQNPIANAAVWVFTDGLYEHTTNSSGKVRITIPESISLAYLLYEGNDTYGQAYSEVSIPRTIPSLVETKLNATYDNATKILTVTLKDADGNPIGDANITVTISANSTTRKTNATGQMQMSLAYLIPDTYTAYAFYGGNGTYNGSSASASVTVSKKTSQITATNPTIISGDDEYLIITLTDTVNPIINADITVIINGNKTIKKTNETGQVQIPLAGLAADIYSAYIAYAGDENYTEAIAAAKITVKDKTTGIETKLEASYNDTNKQLTVTLKDKDGNAIGNAEVGVYIDSYLYVNITDVNGKITVFMKEIPAGNHTAYVFWDGNETYREAIITENMTVTKENVRIIADETKITIYDVEDYLEVTLTDENGNAIADETLLVYIEDLGQYQTDSNGQIRIPLRGLAVNAYNVYIFHDENEYYSQAYAIINVTVKLDVSLINADDLISIHNADDYLVIGLVDSQGDAIINATVYVYIEDFNGNSMGLMNFTTDANGQIRISTKTFEINNYTAYIIFSGNENYTDSFRDVDIIITREATQIIVSDMTAQEGVGKEFTITLKDSQGGPIANAVLVVSINGKSQSLTTDSRGQVSISTSGLSPNTYEAVIRFMGNENYAGSIAKAKITILSKANPNNKATKQKTKIVAKKKTFKKAKKVKKYKIKLKAGKKAVAKARVYLTLKGKKYKKTFKAKTNKKGIATFKIKKLNKKGKYTATIKYKGSKKYKASTKKVKIRVKG